MLLGIFHLFAANAKLMPLLRPLVNCGRNALAAYVVVKLFQELVIDFLLVSPEGQSKTLGMEIREIATSIGGDTSGRLSIPLLKLGAALLLCRYLDRKGIYIKI